MKNKNKIILIINFIICFAIQSCKYDKAEFNWSKYNNCEKNLNADTSAIADKLVGKWELKAYFCFWTSGGTHYPETKVVAEFTSDRKVSVTENGSLISEGQWYFQALYNNNSSWKLCCTNSQYLAGIIQLCDNNLISWDSYRDGCDDLFERIK